MSLFTYLLILLSALETSLSQEQNSGLVQKLISQRNTLIQPGLSYINSSTYDADNSLSVENVGCVINVENWTKWLLGDPVYYFKYGSFLPSIKERLKEYFSRIFPLNTLSEFHSREIFPSHREVTIAVNSQADRFTGTSGTLAWRLADHKAHLILMWSIPYNLNIFNSYFAVGMAKLNTRFSRDLLPYWYRQMIRDRGPGGQFIRAEGGEDIVYKHRDLFVIGQFTSGYHPVLNISIMPWKTSALSPSIWHQLYLDTIRQHHVAAQTAGARYTISSQPQAAKITRPSPAIQCNVPSMMA